MTKYRVRTNGYVGIHPCKYVIEKNVGGSGWTFLEHAGFRFTARMVIRRDMKYRDTRVVFEVSDEKAGD